MAFEIAFEGLWTYVSDDTTQRLGLSSLSKESTHVHGVLQVVVDGRVLPHLGYFGPDDVCFNAWARELVKASRMLGSADPAQHVFDEGEQGQPAFWFERVGERVFVSVRRSEFPGDGIDDPAWERVPCSLAELTSGVERFVTAFRATLRAEAGAEVATWWWKQFVKSYG